MIFNTGVSVSTNEPLYELESGVTTGSFRTYNFYAPGVEGVSGDTLATIAGAGYFNAVNYDLQTGDVICAESVRDGANDIPAIATYVVLNTDGVITVAAFNFGAGAIGTANIINEAVIYAKIQDETAHTLLGNPTAGAQAPAEITLGNALEFSGTTLRVPLNVAQYASGTITAAQWNAMSVTPRPIVGAPGANLMVVVDRFELRMTFNGAQYAAGGAVILQYGNTAAGLGVQAASGTVAAATINGIAASSALAITGFTVTTATAAAVNTAVTLSNQTAAFTTGDGTWQWNCWYRTVAAA